MSSTKTNYEGIEGLRALSCIGIVCMHMLKNLDYTLSGFVFERLIPSFTNLVFLFMVISGFGMCCGYYNRFINKEVDLVDFYKKRYKKILPFFALLCLLDFAISPSIGSLVEVFANLTLCFGLIPDANITVIGVGWFLGVVFVFYMIFPFFCFLLANKKRAWFSLGVAYLMNLACKYYFGAGRESIAYSFAYFMVGGLVFLYKDELENVKYKQIIMLVLICATLFCYFYFGGYTITMMFFNAFVLIYGLGIRKSILKTKPLIKLGGISFEIYLCHMVVYRIVEKLHLTNVLTNPVLNYLSIIVIVLLGAIVFALVCKKLLDVIIRFMERRFVVNG